LSIIFQPIYFLVSVAMIALQFVITSEETNN